MTRKLGPAGALTAIVTPFRDDGKVDEDTFRKLLAFQVAEGIDGLVPCGTTGESPTLSWDEHDSAIELSIKIAGDRAFILAGTGSNSTEEAIGATQNAKDAGAHAALLVDCYYNGPSSLELREEYYGRVRDAVSDIALVPYVIPGRSGCALSAEDVAYLHLRDPERFPAIKEATGDLARMRHERGLAGAGLAIFSGDDELTLPMMQDEGIRAAGVISVMSNLVPGAIGRMVRAQARGDAAEAKRLADGIGPLLGLVGCPVESTRRLPNGREVKVLDKFRNPSPVKTMMAGLGIIRPGLRAPLGPMSKLAVDACRAALRTVHERFPEALAPLEAAFDVHIAARLDDDAAWARVTRHE